MKDEKSDSRLLLSSIFILHPSSFNLSPETPVGIEPTSTGLQPVAWPSGSSVKYPRQELNLIHDLRKVVCAPAHPEDSRQESGGT